MPDALRKIALAALKIAVAPMLFIGFMMWASMSADPAVGWYVAATVAIIYLLCFLFLGAVELSARRPREPRPVTFAPSRTMELAAVALLLIVAAALLAVLRSAFGW